MERGAAPKGPDGRPVNLHHVNQQNRTVQEVPASYHQQNSRALYPRGNEPSLIDRALFDTWKKGYWKFRAQDFT